MAKRSKKFEEVTHGLFKVNILVDANGRFSCAYGGEDFVSAVLLDVRRWAKERLRACAALDWQPVMMVSFEAEDDRMNNLRHCAANVGCYMERYYVAWDGTRWVQCPWVVQPPGLVLCSAHACSEMEQEEMPAHDLMQQRIACSKVFYPAAKLGQNIQWPLIQPCSLGSIVYWVPWTPERWATMLGIMDKMRELRLRIHQLLASESGWLKLAMVAGAKLLPEKAEYEQETT